MEGTASGAEWENLKSGRGLMGELEEWKGVDGNPHVAIICFIS